MQNADQVLTAFVRRCHIRVAAAYSVPPYGGNAFLNPHIVTSADPSAYRAVPYRGQEIRTMFDRRTNGWIKAKALNNVAHGLEVWIVLGRGLRAFDFEGTTVSAPSSAICCLILVEVYTLSAMMVSGSVCQSMKASNTWLSWT